MSGESAQVHSVPGASLPRPTSLFVGREAEIAQIVDLLRGDARLVTLTGPGGSGKTRLAIEAADRAAPDFSVVWWVGLSALRASNRFLSTLAVAIGAHDDPAERIGDARLLLALDNFEQVVEAATDVMALIEACPNLSVLVTSRELLRIPGEVEYAVPPMARPEAVDLFCRLSRLLPDPAVEELCHRLDDLPLALELAAARTSVLSPAQILARLSERLDLFHAGRGAEPRQHTLRAAMEWSVQLLAPEQLRLFTRLGVFDGGCSLPAAERVAGADLDGMQSLVDKSLVRHSGERFWMLETIREYAAELLSASPDERQVRDAHLDWFVEFLHTSDLLLAQGHPEMAARMEQEFANIRAALTWSIASGAIAKSLNLISPRLFWQSVQTHLGEGHDWMETVLARAQDAEPPLRARALTTAADLRRVVMDLDGARSALQEALRIEHEIHDEAALAKTAYSLGRVEWSVGEYERAEAATRSGLAAAQTTGDEHATAESMSQLAEVVYRLGSTDEARRLASDVMGKAQHLGDTHTEAEVLRVAASIERDAGDLDQARALLGRAIALLRPLGDAFCLSLSLGVLGDVELRAGRPGAAVPAFAEALELQRTIEQWQRALDSLWGLAAAAVLAGQFESAARLFGAEERLREESGAAFQVSDPEQRERLLAALKDSGPVHVTAACWQQGKALSRDEAIALALSAVPTSAEPPPVDPVTSSGLFRREGEYWTIRYDGDSFRLRDTKGLHYLSTLLQAPGRELHVLDLAAIAPAANAASRDSSAALRDVAPASRLGDAGPVLDERAKASYRSRLRELEDDLAEATAWADTARAAQAREEIDFLTQELASAVGLGGRDRRAASQAERARVNITRAIRSTLDRIRVQSPALHAHLDATLHTGVFCSYTPDPRSPMRWQ